MKSQKILALAAAAGGILALGSVAHAAIIPSLGAASSFAVLGLEGGNFTINSATTINGNVGVSKNVTVGNAQKVGTFNGVSYVDSTSLAGFNSKNDGSLNPVQSGPAVDASLAQANTDALAASAAFTSMAITQSLGNLTSNQTVVSTGQLNVISLSSLNYNSDTLTLQSRSGQDDYFIFDVMGNFDFSQSTIALTDGTTADHVIFNFPNASNIDINKSTNIFNGTVLAPTSSLIYHNPAEFNGAIIALDIDLHSAFNINQITFGVVPEPASLGVLGLGAIGLILRRRRRTA